VEPSLAPAPLAQAQDARAIARELQALPQPARLLRIGDFEVFCAPAAAIPVTLRELGRLREWAFRAVGEGTGQASDIDPYDSTYHQLFVWNHATRQIAGAYRVGFTEAIARSQGVAGLYTHSLFEYDQRLLDRLGPSLEMGRSFVHPDWQGSARVLRLLWSGIALLLERHPELNCLFGPVSISPRYSAVGRALMVTALQLHHMDAELKPLIRPRNAPPGLPGRAQRRITEMGAGLGDTARLSRVLSLLERGMGLPMLIKHYIELRGRFAAFNVDASFNQTLDGLIFVRVADIPPRLRARLTAVGSLRR
jgi:putative hemolysin